MARKPITDPKRAVGSLARSKWAEALREEAIARAEAACDAAHGALLRAGEAHQAAGTAYARALEVVNCVRDLAKQAEIQRKEDLR